MSMSSIDSRLVCVNSTAKPMSNKKWRRSAIIFRQA